MQSIDTTMNTDNWVKEFAQRHHRLHHLVWHVVRQEWPKLDKTRQDGIRKLGWEPPRTAVKYVGTESTRPEISNGSGEDFLFMHRGMIAKYKELNGGKIKSWVTPPQPPDKVPPAWTMGPYISFERRMKAIKGDEYYWSRMVSWDREFKDPTRLVGLTLGELGSLLEFSIHNDMHMRWAAQPKDPKTGALLPLGRIQGDIDTKWDNPEYNYLGEFYSSHVHPLFWSLHGWIDNRIDDWFAAHEGAHPGEIKRKGTWFEPGKWVQVTQPWQGPHAHDVTAMEKVVGFLFPKDLAAEAADGADEAAALVGVIGGTL